ncbi:MAG: DUF4230 domain-containing protein [Candidatus Methylacidiphilales bacterium]|nr:DUF4230 domain-containing protein [Candidatus Methylacidiphilales bacterium]
MKRDWTGVAVFLCATLGLGMVVKSCGDRLAEAPRKAREEVMAAARDAGAVIQEVFHLQPRVTVQETLVLGQSAPVAELAVIEQDFPLTFNWSHEWLGSTKRVLVTATWRAKAGFDLMKPFHVEIDPETRAVSADLPAAEILSVELGSDLQWQGGSGWWNKLTEEDRQGVMRDFRARAREKIEASGLAARAEAEVRQRLQELLDRQENRRPFEFRFRREQPPAATGPAR